MVIRKLNKSDLSFLLEIRNHESTRINLEDDSYFTLDQCEEWFDNLQSPWYIIEVNNTRVGYIRTDGDLIGIDIHMNYRKQGYATLAFKEYLKDKENARLWVFENNFAKKLYTKLGFIETGNRKFVRWELYIEMIYIKNIVKNNKITDNIINLKSSVTEVVGELTTQIIHFVGGEKRTFNDILSVTIRQGQFTKFQQKDGTWIMVNDKNVLCIEVYNQK